MRLTLHTDYAIRVMVHVGLRNGDLVTITEIADCYGISKNHLTKVVHQLGRIGYLETVRGKYGGVRLLRSPEKVRLGEFIREVAREGARLYACSMALAAWVGADEDLIGECSGAAGATAFVARTLDPRWRTLSY